jgi:VWFA-related protein
MTLRLQKHFTTRALFLALIFGLTPVNFLGARISTASGSERGSINGPIADATLATARGTDQEQKQKPQTEPMLRIETDLVQIDVVVADKAGKLARDLRREDFELYEDGKKQPITHFAIGTATQPANWLAVGKKKPAEKSDGAAAIPIEVRAGRYIIIAVDDFHLAPENLMIAKRTLLRFINQQMVAGDQMAIATTSGNIGMFQQFTNERDVLERAVNRLNLQNRTVTSSSDIPRISDYQAELIDLGDRDALELAVQEILRFEGVQNTPPTGGAGGGRGGARGAQGGANAEFGTSPRERAISQAQSRARMIVGQNAHYTRATLSTLEGIIRRLRDLPGRKLLVLLSDGFFLGGSSSSQIFDMRRLTDAATYAGVVIYSIDARGLVVAIPGGDASQPSGFSPENPGVRERIEMNAVQAKLNGLNALAADTGGKLLYNSNDLNLGLQRVLDENETYYVLAYEPAVSYRDGRFRKIEVRIADRPELKVRTRKGYFAPTEKTEKAAENASDKNKEKSPEKVAQQAKLEKEKEMRAGLGSLFPLREIPVEMAVDFLDVAGGGSGALINTHIDAKALDLSLVNGTHQSALDLLVALFDEKGKLATSFSERVSFNIRPERLENAIKYGMSYRRLTQLKPGFYQARVAVREEGSARLGSASKWVEVPDLSKKQLTLSGILLSSGEEEPQNLQPANNIQSGYNPRPSSAARRFKRGGAVDFMVFAYNARIEKNVTDLVIQSQVYSGSKLVYASPLAKMNVPENSDLQRIPYAARISLEDFTSGSYELRLVVIDRSTKATAFRRVYFTVE